MISRILLTGATGFVGKQVLNALQQGNSDIVLIVRNDWEKKIKNHNGISKVITTKNLFSESREWWEKACLGVNIVVHLAWYLEPGQYLKSDKNMDCYRGSLRLAEGAANSGVQRIVGIGTCFEYDLSNGLLSINTPLKPMTPYAIAKVALFEKLTKLLLLRYNFLPLYFLN